MDKSGNPNFIPMERSETLTDQAYQRLRESLSLGQFLPGQKITTRGIAAALGISATPAREALNRLVAEHVLEFGPNRIALVKVLKKADINEMYEIRMALESLAAGMAAASLDDANVEQLVACQRALVDARERQDFKSVLSLNKDFHFTIYRASGRPLLVSMIESLWTAMGPTMNLLYPDFSNNRSTARYHTWALDAARAHDKNELSKAIIADLSEGRSYLLSRDKFHSGHEV